jgi:hypothetical protein
MHKFSYSQSIHSSQLAGSRSHGDELPLVLEVLPSLLRRLKINKMTYGIRRFEIRKLRKTE